MENLLTKIYGPELGVKTARRIRDLQGRWVSRLSPPREGGDLPLDQKDVVLITYGDTIQGDASPLAELERFARTRRLQEMFSGIHILPFCPYSSDDGFSVIDYRKVDSTVGSWQEICLLGERFDLMFDLVLNHCSASSAWFQGFRKGEAAFQDYFVTVDPSTDLGGVFRPRALPLLHAFSTSTGEKHLWTTFSGDQVDLNFSNPEVLLEFIDILLFYLSQGARMIRLDAVGFLWKEIGTSCIHHPKTHAIIQVIRQVLKDIAPQSILITETNVPHKENISYFGNHSNEAHMVYQFALPPLTLDAFIRGDTTHLQMWACHLAPPDGKVTYFNFLASHDGVGLLAAREILTQDQFRHLIDQVAVRGGHISYKETPKGEIPYELNINYRDAIAEKTLTLGERGKKFLASQAVMLAMAGVPGVYIHTLLGSGNWSEGVAESGIKRRINREKIAFEEIERRLQIPGGLEAIIFSGLKKLLILRRRHKAFHPAGGQEILASPKELFALVRTSPDGQERLLCVHNTTGRMIPYDVPSPHGRCLEGEALKDLISGRMWRSEKRGKNFSLVVAPYGVLWLQFSRK